MANNKKAVRKSRSAVPTNRRRGASYKQPPQRQWLTLSMVDAGIVIFATLATTLLLLIISGQTHDTTIGNLMSPSVPNSATMVVLQPTPQPSSSPGHATPSPQPTPSVAPPTPTVSAEAATPEASDDSSIQSEVDKRIQDQPDLSNLDITATVRNGKVTLVGTVPTDQLKSRIERLVRSIRGVRQVDNQIVVVTP